MLRALIAVLVLTACSPPIPPQAAAELAGEARAPDLAEPSVTIEADPAPPFTYWAPDGAVIRNHPNGATIWTAHLNGRNVATYFGDQCRASQYQRHIGEPLEAFTPPADAEVRVSCATCPVTDDLRMGRINVLFDEETRRITKIACY